MQSSEVWLRRTVLPEEHGHGRTQPHRKLVEILLPRLRRWEIPARRPARADVVHHRLARSRVADREKMCRRLLPIGDALAWQQHSRPELAVATVLGNDRPPPGEPAPRLILALRSSHSRSLHEADRVGDLSRPASGESDYLA